MKLVKFVHEQPKKLHTAGLVVIEDRKLLLAFSRRKQAYYLPGGKLNEEETATEALIREIKEELSIDIPPTALEYYCHITAPAFGEYPPKTMEQDCFFCQQNIAPKAGAEIDCIGYFTFSMYKKEAAQVPGVLTIFERLIKDDKVDL